MSFLLPHTVPGPWDTLEKCFTGAKALRYATARRQAQLEGVVRRDANISMFVKFEKIDLTKENPDPRPIQFRGPKYCVELSRYLKPLEHALYTMSGDGMHFPPGRLIGKGMNQRERGTTLREMWDGLVSPACVVLDASRFDMHCSAELLAVEHSVYNRVYADDRLAQLLSWQLVNHGSSRLGMKYTTRGGRMSGDMNTALGNCVLMVLMLTTYMKRITTRYRILDDGDDVVLMCERDDLEQVLGGVTPWFLSCGHEIKVECVVFDFQRIVYCQASPIEMSPGSWRMVRDPSRVMSRALVSTKMESPKATAAQVRAIAQAELCLNLGVPVLQEWCLALLRATKHVKAAPLQDTEGYYHQTRRELRSLGRATLETLKSAPVTQMARESYMLAFGVSLCDQLHQEHLLRMWSPSLTGHVHALYDLLPGTWTRASRDYAQKV